MTRSLFLSSHTSPAGRRPGEVFWSGTVPAAGKLPEIPEEAIIPEWGIRSRERIQSTGHCGQNGRFTRGDKGNPGRKNIHHALLRYSIATVFKSIQIPVKGSRSPKQGLSPCGGRRSGGDERRRPPGASAKDQFLLRIEIADGSYQL